jgi:hypothetical protein
MTIVVNHSRALVVLDALMARYEANGLPYSADHVRLPQDARHLPRGLSRDPVRHAMFFFNLCYWMRGGTSSVDAAIKLGRLFTRHPDFFDAPVAAQFSEERLVLPLTNVGLTGMINSARVFWPENARRLNAQYNGDPRQIFTGITTYEQLVKRAKNNGKGGGFQGFGKKMASMLAYYYIDQGLIQPQPYAVPVDFHLMRIALANELVRVTPEPSTGNLRSDELEDTLRSLFSWYASKRGVDPRKLTNALWLLGSNLCSNQPGNRAKQGPPRARATHVAPVIYRGTPAEVELLLRTCGQCPLEETCTGNFPSPYYYRKGILVRTGIRPRVPNYSLSPTD